MPCSAQRVVHTFDYQFTDGGGNRLYPQEVRSIQTGSGKYVDRIELNGSSIGGPGGSWDEFLMLKDEEYIDYVHIRAGRHIDRLEIKTNLGNGTWGGSGGGSEYVFNNIRLLKLGVKSLTDGRGKTYIAGLALKYLENYQDPVKYFPDKIGVINFYPKGLQTTTGRSYSKYKSVYDVSHKMHRQQNEMSVGAVWKGLFANYNGKWENYNENYVANYRNASETSNFQMTTNGNNHVFEVVTLERFMWDDETLLVPKGEARLVVCANEAEIVSRLKGAYNMVGPALFVQYQFLDAIPDDMPSKKKGEGNEGVITLKVGQAEELRLKRS
eukprot:GHVU01072283.1.p1 GENE.GHVU01072283.1~~GHVU01072283.1.p1  ORF type:complete len:326 (+),score=44.06 GHVU01072283.1:216-1193(+)